VTSQRHVPGAERVVGVLLAAGRGRRMGGSKQLIRWNTPEGPKPLVAASFDAIRPACRCVIVVLGHNPDAVRSALAPRTFIHTLADPDAPMFESIIAGVQRARQLDRQASVLLQPADHPEVRTETLQALLTAHAAHPDQAIIPDFRGTGGHPILIPPALVDVIASMDPAHEPGGLRALWRREPERCMRLTVEDPGVVRDLDTPDDLQS